MTMMMVMIMMRNGQKTVYKDSQKIRTSTEVKQNLQKLVRREKIDEPFYSTIHSFNPSFGSGNKVHRT